MTTRESMLMHLAPSPPRPASFFQPLASVTLATHATLAQCSGASPTRHRTSSAFSRQLLSMNRCVLWHPNYDVFGVPFSSATDLCYQPKVSYALVRMLALGSTTLLLILATCFKLSRRSSRRQTQC